MANQTKQPHTPQKKKENPNQHSKIQDKALNALKKTQSEAQFQMISGRVYEMDVRDFDKFTILGLENGEEDEYTVLFKHGIESARVPRKKRKE